MHQHYVFHSNYICDGSVDNGIVGKKGEQERPREDTGHVNGLYFTPLLSAAITFHLYCLGVCPICF